MPEAITLVPGRQYSFASFASASHAKAAVETTTGLRGVTDSGSPLYLTYVDKVPSLGTSTEFNLPPGLMVIEDFISEEEEAKLKSLINWNDSPHNTSLGQTLKHRQVRHFGYEFRYDNSSVEKDSPLPEGFPTQLDFVCEHIMRKCLMAEKPDQLTVNRYCVGQGIPPHVDTHSAFTDEILSLSVGSGIVMDFQKEKLHYAVYLPPRSLCVMTGPARYEWTHGISFRSTDVVCGLNGKQGLQLKPRGERVSFTFRKIRKGGCGCHYHKTCDTWQSQNCDSQGNQNASCGQSNGPSQLEALSPAQVEKEHVLNVYEEIAGHFSQTRHKPWPNVLDFVKTLPPGSLLLDIGCGNGKYLGHNSKIFEVGCDTSQNLLNICLARGFHVVAANCLSLPFHSDTFDACICIAVIHHLATEERRHSAIVEMARVLRPGGYGLVYVWALEQRHGEKKSAYLKLKLNSRKHVQEKGKSNKSVTESSDYPQDINLLPSMSGSSEGAVTEGVLVNLPIHENRTEFTQQDMLVPWKLNITRSPESSDSTPCTKASEMKTPGSFCLESHLTNSNWDCPDSLGIVTHDSPPKCSPAVFHRFYHLFTSQELERLCSTISEIKVTKSYYDEGNWCVIIKKIG